MYNRYVRNDSGQYQCVPVHEEPPSGGHGSCAPPPPPPPPDCGYQPFQQGGGPRYGNTAGTPGGDGPCGRDENGSPGGGNGGKKRGNLLSGILGKLNLDGIDTGDLLLLLIIALLFKEGEDEEMLIALALLLIL